MTDGSVCENCGNPAEYDSEMILCEDCEKEANRAEVGKALTPGYDFYKETPLREEEDNDT